MPAGMFCNQSQIMKQAWEGKNSAKTCTNFQILSGQGNMQSEHFLLCVGFFGDLFMIMPCVTFWQYHKENATHAHFMLEFQVICSTVR